MVFEKKNVPSLEEVRKATAKAVFYKDTKDFDRLDTPRVVLKLIARIEQMEHGYRMYNIREGIEYDEDWW